MRHPILDHPFLDTPAGRAAVHIILTILFVGLVSLPSIILFY